MRRALQTQARAWGALQSPMQPGSGGGAPSAIGNRAWQSTGSGGVGTPGGEQPGAAPGSSAGGSPDAAAAGARAPAAGSALRNLLVGLKGVAKGTSAAAGVAAGGVRFVTLASAAMVEQARQGLERAAETSAGRALQLQLASAWEGHSAKITAAAVLAGAWLTYHAGGAAIDWVAGLPGPGQQAVALLLPAAAAVAAYSLRHDRLRAAAVLVAAFAGFQAAEALGGWLLELSPGAKQAALAAGSLGAAVVAAQAIRSRTQVRPDRLYQLTMLRLQSNAGVLEVLGAPLKGGDPKLSLQYGGGAAWRGLVPQAVPQRVQLLFPLAGSERRGVVAVEATKEAGRYRFELLAVDVAATPREAAGRIMLAGSPAAHAGALGALQLLREPFDAVVSKQQAAAAGHQAFSPPSSSSSSEAEAGRGTPPPTRQYSTHTSSAQGAAAARRHYSTQPPARQAARGSQQRGSGGELLGWWQRMGRRGPAQQVTDQQLHASAQQAAAKLVERQQAESRRRLAEQLPE